MDRVDARVTRGGALSPPRPPVEALPVALELGSGDAARVTAWIEGVLGWQPVTAGAGLAPRVRLCDVPGAGRVGPAPAGSPTALLVRDDDDAHAVAAAVRDRQPELLVRWPADRDLLPEQVGRLLDRPAPVRSALTDIRVGGSAGGVGATTVALALGALAAWRWGDTLVLTHGTVPVEVPRTVEVEALPGPRTWAAAQRVAAVPGLGVIRADGPAHTVPPVDEAVTTVVRDLGGDEDVDVLVVRRDRAGISAVDRSAAAVVVVRDDGIAPMDALTSAAGGRRLIVVACSARVARAGYLRRVPAALPGSYLRALLPILPGGPGPEERR